MSNRNHYLIIIFLIIASCAAFGRIVGNDFVNFDDNIYITENHHIKSGLNLESMQWAFSAFLSQNWHPLTWISLILDYSLFGENPGGYHFVNLLLHIGAAIFLFLFFNKTTRHPWASAFAAALFALHPLRVESVAWAAERKDVLSMFFGMATLYSYAFYTENPRRFRYLICLVLFACSLMSKSMLVTLPFILMLLDYWPLRRWQLFNTMDPLAKQKKSSKIINVIHVNIKILLEKVPFLFLTFFSCFMTVWAQYDPSVIPLPFTLRSTNAIISYVSYLKIFLLPLDLAVFYPFKYSFPFWQILFACFIVLGITTLAFHVIKTMPFFFVGWFWYLGALIPVIGLVPVNAPMADHYTYLPSIGISIMVVWSIHLLLLHQDTMQKIVSAAGIAVLMLLAIITWQQCGYWKNSVTLFKRALQVTKNNNVAHYSLGFALSKEGKFQEAFFHYNEAIAIRPHYYLPYSNRGNVYAKLEQYQRAIEDYDQAIRLKPDDAITYYNRANAYYNLHQYQQAIEDYNQAIRLKPDDPKAYNNRGGAYFAQGNYQRGCHDAQMACALGGCIGLEWAKSKGFCR